MFIYRRPPIKESPDGVWAVFHGITGKPILNYDIVSHLVATEACWKTLLTIRIQCIFLNYGVLNQFLADVLIWWSRLWLKKVSIDWILDNKFFITWLDPNSDSWFGIQQNWKKVTWFTRFAPSKSLFMKI